MNWLNQLAFGSRAALACTVSSRAMSAATLAERICGLTARARSIASASVSFSGGAGAWAHAPGPSASARQKIGGVYDMDQPSIESRIQSQKAGWSKVQSE